MNCSVSSMKQIRITFVLLVLTFSSLVVFGQVTGQPNSISYDAITKIIGVASILVGVFVGYMQLRMANEIATVKASFTEKINLVEKNLLETLNKESEKLETHFHLGVKELENKMATKQDITQIERMLSLQLENIKLQLTTAAENIKISAANK